MGTRKRKPFSQLSLAEDEQDGDSSSKKSRSNSESDQEDCVRRAGTINHIILKNFMCHSFLEVKFTNNISIVIGKNGSGKSAILTALVVGLGGKATLTNRGNSVKSFVKAGKTSGSIEIDLNNTGPMAFKPSVYGKRINIIRNLSAAGGGSYRIRSEDGSVISTQAKELHNITANLNLQVDNPICILNQDTSRNFLSSNDPKNKFTLFMKATKLDTLETEYNKIQQNKRESVRIMAEKEESFKKLQDEIKRLKTKIENHQSVVSLKDKRGLLQRELLWAKVRDVEDELKREQENVESAAKKLNDCKQKSTDKIERINTLNENIKVLEQQIEELKGEIDVQKRPQLDMKSQIDELRRQYNSKKNEAQQIQTTLTVKRNDAATLENNIASANENMSKVEQQKMKRIKDLAALQNQLKGMDDHLETAKNDLFQIKSDLSRKDEEEQNLRQELRQVDIKMANEKNNLSAATGESTNDLLVYGRNMPRVKQMIQQYRHKFKQEPKGPLGSYITLKDKKWAVAVEGYLGPSLLSAFAVDNNQDNQILREIFSKVWEGKQPQIITSKFVFKKHDVSKNLVLEPKDCISLYNAIEIEDPVVSNCVVDNSGPENILLIPSDGRAQELLSHQQNVPRNCYRGVTIKGDQYYPDPNYRTYGSQYHRAKFLQVDMKEYIRQLQQNIQELTQKRHTVFQQLNAFVGDLKKQIAHKDELEGKVRKVNMARVQIRKQLEEVNSNAEPEVQNIQYLEQELEEIRAAITEKNASLGKIADDIKEIKANISANEHKLSGLKDSTKGLEERIQSFKTEVKDSQTRLTQLSTSDDLDKRRIQHCETKLVEARSQMALKLNETKKVTADAALAGERMPDLRTVPEITNEMNEIKNKIARIETDTEPVTTTIGRYNELSEKFKKSVDIMRGLESDLNELSAGLDRRNRHYKLTENYFVTYMKYSFKKILEFRHFEGTIEINMPQKTLELVVIPQHGSQGHTTTSNLSGGERSFSTVAFLYSLWQCMEFPFYFLDEFDVYMDKLNRTKVIDILLHHAKSKPELQFVFLTPQDVSFINKDVSILRLEDPKRFNA